MNKREAKNQGKDRGYEFASNIELLPDGRTLEEIKTKFFDECYEIEQNDRQNSPFEFTAKEINDSEFPDEIWECFDSGIWDGIYRYWREMIKNAR